MANNENCMEETDDILYHFQISCSEAQRVYRDLVDTGPDGPQEKKGPYPMAEVYSSKRGNNSNSFK